MDARTLAVVLLLLFCAVVIALHTILRRWILDPKNGFFSIKEILIAQNFISATIILATFPWGDLGLDPLTQSLRLFWIGVAITTVANIVIQWVNAEASRLADASLTAPIQAMTPLLITGAALLFHEVPSQIGIAGILLIAVGTYVHASEKAVAWSDYLKPFRLLRLPSNYAELPPDVQKRYRNDRLALALAYTSAACGTIGLVGDSLTSRTGNIGIGFAIQQFLLGMIFLAIVPKTAAKKPGPFLERVKRYWKELFGLGGLFALAIMSPLYAFRLAPVAYVGSLKRLSIVMIVILAGVLLKETKAKRRLIPATVITIGAIMLFFDPASQKIVAAAEEFFK